MRMPFSRALLGELLLLFSRAQAAATISDAHALHAGQAEMLTSSMLLPVQPKLFYIGVQKAGTSSFADFVWRSLNYSLVYHQAFAAYAAFGFNPANCTGASPTSPPDYAQWTQELNTTGTLERALATKVGAFADLPWYAAFEFIEQHVPHAKFVIWERDPTEWVQSHHEYFCDAFLPQYAPNSRRSGLREFLLNYGDAYLCDLPNATAQAMLNSAYKRHLSAVHSYFDNGPAERSSRLLKLDFTSEDAGRKLCEFVYDAPPPSELCAHLTLMPNVPPEKLDPSMQEPAIRAINEASCTDSPLGLEACVLARERDSRLQFCPPISSYESSTAVSSRRS